MYNKEKRMLKRRRSRLVCAENDLEWNGMECSGIRLKNFFLRLNPPLAGSESEL